MLNLMDIASEFCNTAMFVIIDLQTIFHKKNFHVIKTYQSSHSWFQWLTSYCYKM
jgi:hypothetical protein